MKITTAPRVKAMCVVLHDGKTLASRGFDSAKNEHFARLIGGSVELGEKSEDAVRREVREELRSEIENVSLVKIVENIFTYEGKQGHDVVFVFKADLVNKELYKKNSIHIVEPYGEFEAEWIPISDILEGKIPLYPAMDYSEILK